MVGIGNFVIYIADEQDQFRALEIAAYIAIMLAGAFPMVYLIKKYLAKPMEAIGTRVGLTSTGAAGCSLCVGVLTGTGSAADLGTEADHVLDSIADLEALIDGELAAVT